MQTAPTQVPTVKPQALHVQHNGRHQITVGYAETVKQCQKALGMLIGQTVWVDHSPDVSRTRPVFCTIYWPDKGRGVAISRARNRTAPVQALLQSMIPMN